MDDGPRIDWFAIPGRFRRWQALPAWRRLLWLFTRSLTMVVAYVAFAAAILWYNEPALVEGIGAGREPVWSLPATLTARPELLAIMAILVPAVVAAVLLPHKQPWER